MKKAILALLMASIFLMVSITVVSAKNNSEQRFSLTKQLGVVYVRSSTVNTGGNSRQIHGSVFVVGGATGLHLCVTDVAIIEFPKNEDSMTVKLKYFPVVSPTLKMQYPYVDFSPKTITITLQKGFGFLIKDIQAIDIVFS